MSAQSSTNQKKFTQRSSMVLCNHNLPALVLTTLKPSENQGRRFYRCPQWQVNDCRFFQWYEKDTCEAIDLNPVGMNSTQLNGDYEDLKRMVLTIEGKKIKLGLKIQKLKEKKKQMSAKMKTMMVANATLRAENYDRIVREKVAMRTLYFSWLLIVMLIISCASLYLLK